MLYTTVAFIRVKKIKEFWHLYINIRTYDLELYGLGDLKVLRSMEV